jgi:hypothetical protein
MIALITIVKIVAATLDTKVSSNFADTEQGF